MLDPIFKGKRQAITSGGFLLYNYGDTTRWSNEFNTDMPCKDYRNGIRIDFCFGDDAKPMQSIKVTENGVTGSGKDLAQGIFGERPHSVDDDVLEWVKVNMPHLLPIE